jgi:hypothetical protein
LNNKKPNAEQIVARLYEQWLRAYEKHGRRSQRFGQYVCNQVLKSKSYPELFYCESTNSAYSLATKILREEAAEQK